MNPWLLCRRKRPDARLRLYCFPHSGGSAGEFLRWADDLPDVEVWGVQTPGRGTRLDEPSHTRMDDLVRAIVTEVDFAGPCAFFGHSLGALVAYEVAVALRDLGRPGPERLLVSAHEAPHRHVRDDTAHRLDQAGLIAAVEEQFGPLPAEVRDDPEWQDMVLGPLRADLSIVAGYQYRPATPLDCAITALGGTADTVGEADLACWDRHTTGAFALHLFAGGHFYFREHHDDVLRRLAADLAGLLR
ncbi:alpha/beta fold hydrolase [Saccharothrix sp.]|uniref:thioesterase II family protein n=1 Tax=Saccharothrix sp. TaxID=1873460 RepID=UPI0028125666|nr:alpha/beta fold hydrolase [Saccharothrix sp.]